MKAILIIGIIVYFLTAIFILGAVNNAVEKISCAWVETESIKQGIINSDMIRKDKED